MPLAVPFFVPAGVYPAIALDAEEAAATECIGTSELVQRAQELGVTGSWDEMFQAVARAHKGEQQQAGSLAEEEFIPVT